MKRSLIIGLALAAVVVSQSVMMVTACERTYVRYYRPASMPAKVAVVISERQIVTVEKAPEAVPVIENVVAAQVSAVGIPSGATLRVNGFFGKEPGSVFLTVGKVMMECPVSNWNPTRVSFALPDLGLLDPTAAVLDIARVDGQIAKRQRVVLTAKPDLEIISSEPTDRSPSPEATAGGQIETGGLVPSTEKNVSVVPASEVR